MQLNPPFNFPEQNRFYVDGSGQGTTGSSVAVISDTVAVRLQETGPPHSIENDVDFRSRPALYVSSADQVSLAVQRAIEYWCSEGPPDLLISVLSDTGALQRREHQLPRVADRLKSGFLKLSMYTNCWFISSGLQSDPLARAAGRAVRTVAEEREYMQTHSEFIKSHRGDMETKPETDVKLFAVNSIDIAPGLNSASAYEELKSEANGWHTHFILLENRDATEEEIEMFRRNVFLTFCESANIFGEPCASGGADSRYVTFPLKRDESSGISRPESLPVPLYTNEPPKLPSVVIFAGSSISNLKNLWEYLNKGIPVLVIEESSRLCTLLYLSYDYYARHPSDFDDIVFSAWLDQQLRLLASETNEYTDSMLGDAKKAIRNIMRNGEKLLNFFCLENSEESLEKNVVDACLKAASNPLRFLLLIIKLGIVQSAYTLDISGCLESSFCCRLFEESLFYPYRNPLVAYFLDSGLPICYMLNSSSFIRLLKNCQFQDFFTTVILGHLLGYPGFPHDTRRLLRSDLSRLLGELALINRAMPSSVLLGGAGERRHGEFSDLERKSHDLLTYWAVLMNRGEVAKLLWAYSHDPIPLALVLSQMCKSLAERAHDWYFYESHFRQLGRDFSQMAVGLLARSHGEAPHRSYDVLCHSFEQYAGLAATHLAYQSGNKAFIAHECCQMWVNRLLYGRLRISNLSWGCCEIPSWLKVVFCTVFVLPIRLWLRPRYNVLEDSKIHPRDSADVLYNNQNGVRNSGSANTDRPRMTQSNCSMLSVRSLREETLVMQNEPAMAEGSVVNAVAGTYAPLATSEFPSEDPDAPGTVLVNSFVKCKRNATGVSAEMPFAEMVWNFYCTPVAKFWFSLLFRLFYLMLFGYALSLPGCGRIDLDLAVWLWSFISWTESLWILYLKKQELTLRNLHWQLADCCIVMVFLVLMLVFKIAAGQPETQLAEAYIGRCAAAFFLLYMCYATLFVYVPMSNTLGPLLVRVKLMVLRDLVNYLVLVVLVIASCAVVVHAVLFPDYPPVGQLWRNAFHWAWFSLFTTDIDDLEEPQKCKKFTYQSEEYCAATGGYANPECPRPSWASYLAVIQYLIILKLISWPLLFALFGKTAKEVDDEADHVWKYQFYGLVTEFSLRPPLPPPFTPLVLLFLCCFRTYGGIRKQLSGGSDHPDAAVLYRKILGPIHLGSVLKFGRERDTQYYTYWRSLALQYWKEQRREVKATPPASNNCGLSLPDCLIKQATKNQQVFETETVYMDSTVKLLGVDKRYRCWDTLLPIYYPPSYSKSVEEFSETDQLLVEHSKQPTSVFLNPFGRCGIQGRGCLPKFGSNDVFYLFLTKGDSKEFLVRLCENNKFGLPRTYADVAKNIGTCLSQCFQVQKISDKSMAEKFQGLVFFLEGIFSQLFYEYGENVAVGEIKQTVNYDNENVKMSAICKCEAIDCAVNTDNAWVRASAWFITLPESVVTSFISVLSTHVKFVNFSCPLQSLFDDADYAIINKATNLCL